MTKSILCRSGLKYACRTVQETFEHCYFFYFMNTNPCKNYLKKSNLSEEKKFLLLHLRAALHSCSHNKLVNWQERCFFCRNDNVAENLVCSTCECILTLNYFLLLERYRERQQRSRKASWVTETNPISHHTQHILCHWIWIPKIIFQFISKVGTQTCNSPSLFLLRILLKPWF